MSNVLKSKVLLGAMIVLAAVVGAMFIATTANAYTHSVTLKMGMSHSQVMELQKALNATSCKVASSGVGSSGMETMYFGGLTKAAVMCYQAANALTADGVVGPMTGAKLGMVVDNDNDNDNNDNNDLQGGAGAVQSYDLVSGLNNEEVGEDEEDVQVAGLEVEADEGSDLELTAVKLVFDEGTAGSDFEDYADEVSVWFEGEEVARADADSFNDDNDWTKTLSLDGAMLEADETGELVVAVSGISNLDTNDAGDTWTVDFRSVRFVDAQNASTTEDPGVAARTFSFESFATAADVEMKVALNEDDDDINEAHVLDVDTSDDTDGVEVLSFTIEADGDSDIMIDDIPVLLTTTEAAGTDFNDPDDVVSGVTLFMNGDEVGSESLSTGDADGDTETVTFDDLGITVDAGDTAEFTVEVDLISTGGVLDDGDTIKAELTGTEVDAIDAEDESGENISDANATGTAAGEAHAVYASGIMVDFVSASATRTAIADATGESDTGEFKISFKVTAFDADMRIDKSCEHGGSDAAGQGTEWDETISAADTTGWTLGCTVSSSTTDSEDTANVFEVDEDTTRTFTITVNLTPDEDSYAEVFVESINWGTATNDTNANYYTFNLNDFKTDSIFLNDM